MNSNVRAALLIGAVLSLTRAPRACAQKDTVAHEEARDPRSVQPERPTVATHAHTVAPDYFEIEAGTQGDRISHGDRFYFSPIVLKVGLAEHLQLNVTPPVTFGTNTGTADGGVGLKWRVLDDHPLLGDFAILPAVTFVRGGGSNLSATLISSHEAGILAIDLNAIYTRENISGSSRDAALLTASFGASLTPKFGWVLEIFGEPTIDGSHMPATASILTGPTFIVSPEFAIDAGVIAPFHGDTPNSIYAGFVWNVGRLFSPGASELRRSLRR